MTREATVEHDGKVRYGTYLAADLYLRRKRRHKSARKRRLEVYKCIFCRSWHVGTQPTNMKKAR